MTGSELRKSFRNTSDQKTKIQQKNYSQIAACEQKTTRKKAKFS